MQGKMLLLFLILQTVQDATRSAARGLKTAEDSGFPNVFVDIYLDTVCNLMFEMNTSGNPLPLTNEFFSQQISVITDEPLVVTWNCTRCVSIIIVHVDCHAVVLRLFSLAGRVRHTECLRQLQLFAFV